VMHSLRFNVRMTKSSNKRGGGARSTHWGKGKVI